MQIGHGCRLTESKVATSLHVAGSTAGDKDRQIQVVMDIGISHAATVQQQRMIQQRAVAFLCLLQALQEVREQRHMELINFCHLRNFFRIVSVMGERMMWICHANLRISSITGFTSQLESCHASDIALKRQQLQIKHQLCVIGVCCRDSQGAIQIRERVFPGIGFGLLDASFDFADTVEVCVDFFPVGRAERDGQLDHGQALQHPHQRG